MQDDDQIGPIRRLSMSLHHIPGHSEGHGWESSEDDASSHRPVTQPPLSLHDEQMTDGSDSANHLQHSHEHFEELRAKHYRMKEAISEAKYLLRKEGLTDSESELDHGQSSSRDFISY